MNPRVQRVTTTDDYKLRLEFSNGEHGIYDCTPLLNFGVFKELQEPQYFQRATCEHGTVVWPHDQDICPDTLYIDSQKV
jgi:hypothetical protein